MNPLKRCKHCKLEKPFIEFYRNGHGDLNSLCKICQIARQKKLMQERRKDPIELAKLRKYGRKYYYNKPAIKRSKCRRAYTLKLRHGLTENEYASLLQLQDGKCKICGSIKSNSSIGPHLRVDHCHKSGKIRGLLCHYCNVALGMFKDNPDILVSALNYLKENEN